MGSDWALSGPIGGPQATAGTQLSLELDRISFAVNLLWDLLGLVLLSDDLLLRFKGL